MINLVNIEKKLIDKKTYGIVFLGDSLVSSEWVHPNWREIVEYVLKMELEKQMEPDWKTSSWGIRTFNMGFDGATTTDLLAKMDNVVYLKPDLVIFLAGGNDLLFGIAPKQQIENLSGIIDILLRNQVDIMMCTNLPTPILNRDESYKSNYYPLIVRLFANEGVNSVDIFAKYQEYDLSRFFTFLSEANKEAGIKEGELDPLHPNQLGNAYLAKLILTDGFGVSFDPEKYIADTLAGQKFPRY